MKQLLFLSRFSTIFFLGLSAIFLAGCPDEKPVEPQPTNPLQLTVEDATCTEAFLKISLAGSESNRTVILKRGDSTIFSDLRLLTSDTLIIDEGLLPKKTYAYTLVYGDWSASAQAITMDTTSHDWSWTVDTLGIGDSYLYDVAIINDTLAYAVGEMHIRDSSGQYDPQAYNVAKWNGKKWELQRVEVNFRGNKIIVPLEGVFAFSPTDIWIVGSLPIHGDGQNWGIFDLRSMSGFENVSLSKAWGSKSTNVYFIGVQGNIVHYNGTWQKIESGTTVSLNDVWGGNNKWLGDNVVLVAAGEKYTASETKILKLSEQGIDSIPWQNQIRTRQSIWFGKKGRLFSCGSGIFHYVNGSWRHFSEFPTIYTNRIRGNAGNDLVVVGDFGIVGHYNGVNWKVYDKLKLPNGNYESVAMKGNLVIAAGWYGQSGRAVVAVGKR
jgi:hypothetical protein